MVYIAVKPFWICGKSDRTSFSFLSHPSGLTYTVLSGGRAVLFRVTLPGTHAGRPVLTRGKPFFLVSWLFSASFLVVTAKLLAVFLYILVSGSPAKGRRESRVFHPIFVSGSPTKCRWESRTLLSSCLVSFKR